MEVFTAGEIMFLLLFPITLIILYLLSKRFLFFLHIWGLVKTLLFVIIGVLLAGVIKGEIKDWLNNE